MSSPSKRSSKAKTQFLIIDGHALLHRAWHALPPLTTKDGLVVHGAYGFTTIMLGAIRQFGPEYMAVTFDLKGPTFRHEQYKEYKATREKKPDELYAQVDSIRKILEAMEIPVFTAEGFEADDVIGTLSLLAAEQDPNVETIIVTGDMDTLQLVDERTKVFTLRKGMSDTVVYDVKAVKERFGFKPPQLIDYKALRGDPSDNIPGVKGIGEKTGSELIAEFGSVEKLYASLERGDKKAQALKAGVREKLVAHKDDALMALDLCRIRRDVPMKFVLADCAFHPVTREKVAAIFTELEFMKLLKQMPSGLADAGSSSSVFTGNPTASLFDAHRVPGTFAAAKEPGTSGTYATATVVRDVAALGAAITSLSKASVIAVRSAAEGDDRTFPTAFALGLNDGKKTYVISGSALRDGKPLLSKVLTGKATKVCHDLKAELLFMAANGIVMQGPFFDLILASYLLHSGERRHSLTALLAYERGVPIDEIETPTGEARAERLAVELPHFIPLFEDFKKDLAENGLTELNEKMELPLSEVLATMERDGIAIDVPYFGKIAKDVGAELKELTAAIYDVAGGEFNINSPAQLKEVLFDKLGISSEGLKNTKKGKTLSTAASELEKLKGAHPVIAEVLRYRELAKLQSTYIEALPAMANAKTGRIHADFSQTVTATGRLSSSGPNLQNIPTPGTEYGKRVRNGFVASKGFVLVAADYSQIELRIAAHIAREKTMTQAFKDGEDIHYRTAVAMFGEEQAADKRRIAKVINFGILYGMGPNRLSEAAEISFAEAREYIDTYFALHPGIAQYMDAVKAQIITAGYVETLFGRKRFFKNVKLMNPRERAEAERQAINMPIQGTNADMVKAAMVRIADEIAKRYGAGADAKARMLIQVHDELVFEVRKELVDEFVGLVAPIMENVHALDVPVVVNVSTGARWGEMEKV